MPGGVIQSSPSLRPWRMNTTLLREISFQVTRGNPLWGVSVANEYLDRTCALHTGLIARARRTLQERKTSDLQLLELLATGIRANELPAHLRLCIGSRIVQRKDLLPHLAGRDRSWCQIEAARRRQPIRQRTLRVSARRFEPYVARATARRSL